ncbi:MAG: sigma-70 family RNA polymerase sigma factor [Acidobacteria bacterium]|nr:sigma-70 family RNA polymerase sigma factor [Acidobacteriota bacterium]
MRQRLIVIFNNRGCAVSEDLVDETFNRVMRRLPDIIGSYQGIPAPYIYKTAQRVYLDYLAKAWVPIPENLTDLPQKEKDSDEEMIYQCLDQCIKELSPNNRELVLSYYLETRQAKIDHRKEIAESLKIELNAMRIRLYRIRNTLRQCIEQCLQRGLADQLG